MSRTASRQGRTAGRRTTVQNGANRNVPGSAAPSPTPVIGDLGEQRMADDALRASEQLHRSIVETLDEGVMVQDLEGRVVAFNKSSLRILGLSAERLDEGSSYRPLVPLIHEDGSPFLGHEHPSMVSLRTGEPQNGVVMGVEHPDGTRWISINSRALYRPGEDTPYAAVGSCTDITAHRRTLAELHAARLEDLKRLALVGEFRDDDTNRHTERVAHTAALLADELGLEDEQILTIRQAAPLHDVGKIGVSDTILLKPGKLTREEFESIKAHTWIGARILGESDFSVLQVAAEIALTHHEHWDGTGYPQGLRAQDIPISGRIVAVADAFDAMAHARPYKEAFPIARAVAEIERCSGSQFDPAIVASFLSLRHDALVDSA